MDPLMPAKEITQNDACRCGSGKEHQHCCLPSAESKAVQALPEGMPLHDAIETAMSHHRAGHLVQAGEIYRHVLRSAPNHPDALHLLGVIASQTGRHDSATELIMHAISLAPSAVMYNNLAHAMKGLGNPDAAVAACHQALLLDPDHVETLNNLGVTLHDQGKLAAAMDCYLRAISLKPDNASAYCNLGVAAYDLGRLSEAAECYQAALAIAPDYAVAHNNLGNALRGQGKYTEAIASFERALAIEPGYAMACNNLGNAVREQGQPEIALELYQKALALGPGLVDAHSNALFTMLSVSRYSASEIFSEHLRFAEKFEAPLKPGWPAHCNSRDISKRLKVGYLSGDFRDHPVTYFFEPILVAHDKSQVEVFCYHNSHAHDCFTDRIASYSDHWIACKGLSDDALAARILDDGIDILIDLAGHTAENRLLVFARKPAPLQITYLGYPSTTGLSAIDYRLTDLHAEPPGMTDHLNVEQLWRLPEIFCVYRTSRNGPNVIDHPPADDNGYVTFGCFNNFAKVTDQVLGLWGRLLERLPTARLMLEIRGVDHPALRAGIEARLTDAGLPLDRVLLVPRAPQNQFVLYNRIDIALDPFPQNGGTTSFDTLWMGVPFITLAGRHFSSRMGATILSNAGLAELVAADEQQYLELAVSLAQDRLRLAATRAGLREQVLASPLMDAQRFTSHLEHAYRAMWQKWCESTAAEA